MFIHLKLFFKEIFKLKAKISKKTLLIYFLISFLIYFSTTLILHYTFNFTGERFTNTALDKIPYSNSELQQYAVFDLMVYFLIYRYLLSCLQWLNFNSKSRLFLLLYIIPFFGPILLIISLISKKFK